MSLIKRILIVVIGVIYMTSCKHDPFPAPPPGANDTTTIPVDTTTRDTTAIKPCDPDTVYFSRDILPILSSNCAIPQCHDSQSKQDGVILDSYDNTIATGKIKPFEPTEGDFMKLVTYEDFDPGDPNSVMPPLPNTKLSQADIDLIKKWILQGAQDLYCDDCDTANISFLSSILPIFQGSCMSNCHNPVNLTGGISLTNYAEIAQEVKFGEVLQRIRHDQGFAPMPTSGVKIDQCKLDKIDAWVDAGHPNN